MLLSSPSRHSLPGKGRQNVLTGNLRHLPAKWLSMKLPLQFKKEYRCHNQTTKFVSERSDLMQGLPGFLIVQYRSFGTCVEPLPGDVPHPYVTSLKRLENYRTKRWRCSPRKQICVVSRPKQHHASASCLI